MTSILKKSSKTLSKKSTKSIRIAVGERLRRQTLDTLGSRFTVRPLRDSQITFVSGENTSEDEDFTEPLEHVVYVKDVVLSSDSTSGNTSSEEEDEVRQIDLYLYKYKDKLPQEYWQMPKIVKLLRVSNQTGTLIVLKYIYDLLTDQNYRDAYEYAFMYNNGLELLVNILETSHLPSITASLQNLELLARKPMFKRELINLGVIYSLEKILTYPVIENQTAIFSILANLCRMKKARRMLRTSNGIRTVMGIQICDKCLRTKKENLTDSEKQKLKLMVEAMNLWWSLAWSEKCRAQMRKYNFVEIMSQYLKSVHEEAVVPAMGTISMCCQDVKFQLDLITVKDMIKNMFKQLVNLQDNQVRRYTFRAIASIATNQAVSKSIREYGLLPLVVHIMKHSKIPDDDYTMTALLSAVFALANNDENRQVFIDLDAVNYMTDILRHNKNDDVLANAIGTLSELLKIKRSVKYFIDNDGIDLIVDIITSTTSEYLIENSLRAIEVCAYYPELILLVEQKDGIRWIWSLLRHKSNKIKAHAAWCLAPLLKYTPGSGETVKHLIGGFTCAMELLKSKDNEVLAAACALLAEIANDPENLNVLSHFKLVPLLTNLFKTKDEKVQENLSHIIASSCQSEENTKQLTRHGAISLLIVYLQNPKMTVQKSAIRALAKMSKNRFNCITIKESGIEKLLRKYLEGFTDEEMQDESKKCLKNIRNFCMEAEKKHFRNLGYDLDKVYKEEGHRGSPC